MIASATISQFLSGIEDEYKIVNDGQWGWRALRLLAKKSPNFFTYGNNPIAKLPGMNILRYAETEGFRIKFLNS